MLGGRLWQQLEPHLLLPASKLSRPHVPAALVARERLLKQLDGALAHRLTLLSASAGWGKTTLLSAWASQQPHPLAWLSLDAQDNELTRFWLAVIAALRSCVLPLGESALAMLQSPEPPPLSAILTVLLNDVATVAEDAPTESIQREGALLVPKLLEAKQRAMRAGDHLVTIRVMAWLAFMYRRAGQLHLVERESLEALALLEQVGGHTTMAGYPHCYLANAYYAWNRLEAAAGSLQQMLRIARDWQEVDLLIYGYLFLMRIELVAGNLDGAHQVLQRAEELTQQEGPFAGRTHWVVAARVEYWLAAGKLDTASAWAAQVVFWPERWNPNRQWEFLMLIRVYLAQQQYMQALEALERFADYLDRPGDIEITIDFLALRVVALQQAGEHEQARAVAARLLALTRPEDNIRVYLDAGAPMRQVLQSLLAPARPRAQPSPCCRGLCRQAAGRLPRSDQR